MLPSINWTVTSPETESTFYRIPVTSAASGFCGFALGRLVPCKSVLCRSAQPTAAATVIRPISIPAIFVSGKKCIRLRFITSYPGGWIFSYLLPCGAFSALFPGVDANSCELPDSFLNGRFAPGLHAILFVTFQLSKRDSQSSELGHFSLITAR